MLINILCVLHAVGLKKTEEVSNRIFSLPMYPTLTDKEQDIVIEELKKLI